MKKLINLLTFILIAILFSSCEFTERINLNKNGSGTYTLNMDMSAMMQAMKKMGDSTNAESEKPEILDTIMDFNDFLIEKKDSIAKLPKEEQEKLKALKDMKLHIEMNEITDVFNMDFIFEFKSIDELKNIQEKISKGHSLNEKKKESPSPEAPTEVKFSFDGKKFHRIVVDKNLSEEEKEAYKKSMEESASMMNGSSYNIEYHFPKPIKSTTYKDATLSLDRKTLYIKTDLNTITSNPKLLDFEVILE